MSEVAPIIAALALLVMSLGWGVLMVYAEVRKVHILVNAKMTEALATIVRLRAEVAELKERLASRGS